MLLEQLETIELFEETPDPLKSLYSPLLELELKLHDDPTKQYSQQLSYLLFEILEYPNTNLAVRHGEANRLGNYDMIDQEATNTSEENQRTQDHQACICCGRRLQQFNIPTCTPFNKIVHLGLSTILFFQTYKNMMLMMAVCLIVYALPANHFNSQLYASIYNTTSYSYLGSKVISSSETASEIDKIENWVTLALVVLWGVCLVYIHYNERRITVSNDRLTKSASDFTIQIDDLPQDLSLAELQLIFNSYHANVQKMYPNIVIKPFDIIKTNLVPNTLKQNTDKHYLSIKEELNTKLNIIKQWIRDRRTSPVFEVAKPRRHILYRQIQSLKQQLNQKDQELIQNYLTEMVEQNNKITAFVTFRYSQASRIVVNLNQLNWINRLFGNYQKVPLEGISVRRAPEPEDILWLNLNTSVSERMNNMIIVCITTALLLGLSFVSQYGLLTVKLLYENNDNISALMSVTIVIVNTVIGVTIQILTVEQKHKTYTDMQTSYAIKIIIAQLINSIVIPDFVRRYVSSDITLLSNDVLYFSISDTILTPLLLYFDMAYYMRIFTKWFYSFPVYKLSLTQEQLNEKYEGIEFEIAFKYIYVVKTSIYTAYYVSLQPIIVLLSILGLCWMYWLEKYVLFKRCRRPTPGSDTLNEAINYFISLLPIFHVAGSLVMTYTMRLKIEIYPISIAGLISLLIFIFPFREMFRFLMKDLNQSLDYQQEFIFLPNQYDRLNPITKKHAIEHFIKQVNAENKHVRITDKRRTQLMSVLTRRMRTIKRPGQLLHN